MLYLLAQIVSSIGPFGSVIFNDHIQRLKKHTKISPSLGVTYLNSSLGLTLNSRMLMVPIYSAGLLLS